RPDNLLMASETTLDSTVSTTNDNVPILYTEHEEYRYDALGRRVWVRSLHGALCTRYNPTADCLSALKREVWDGAALVYESRYPGDLDLPSETLEQETGSAGSIPTRFGRVAYLDGGALDHPLDVVRMDGSTSTGTFAPRYNWRGLAEEPVCAAGTSCGTQYFGASSLSAYFELPPVSNGPPAWSGGLIEGQRDASGLLYKRNRYYDPASGRFTSQDPLGLGGGLNVYGFASGDPVNEDDPFGLCPDGLSDRQQSVCDAIENTMMALGAIGGGIKGGSEGAVLALPTGEIAGVVTVPAGAILEGAAGAVAGKLWGKALTNFLFKKASNAGKMQREVERGQAPNDVDRVDRGNPSDPGDAEPHVHFKDGSALTQSGRWKHGASEISKVAREWLEHHGWSAPQ
ncbi:MAG: RHS repeat-associated core domain-containing protein, partial [Sciscionella sp.]